MARHTPAQPTTPAASARQADLRSLNLALVASTILSSHEAMSRADVAAATGMTRSTASRLVDELVAGGILAEGEPAPSAGRGRPAVPLTAAHGNVVALGLEVKVSHMAVRAIDLAGQTLAERVLMRDLRGSDPAEVLTTLAGQVSDLLTLESLQQARIVGAALALPGLVSGEELLRAPNLRWGPLRPADFFTRTLEPASLALTVGNEANFGALTVGRSRPGSSGEWDSFIYLSGEDGIGAGIVRGGAIEAGTSGFAGEVGHIQIDPAGPACGCGNPGCLESYAGRRAILAAAGLADDATPETLLAAVERGEPQAQEAIGQAARALGVALGAVVNVLDIPVVVLGGHLAPLTEALRPQMEEALQRQVLASPWTRTLITRSDADEFAGATGAAWSLLEGVIHNPSALLG